MSTKDELASAVPIREVSLRTGVNSVTLRAWERRYGLLKPLRTEKGHRLYRPEDIAQVAAIQSWLARGVAVSQVRALLEPKGEEVHASIGADASTDKDEATTAWAELSERIMHAVEQLHQKSLDHLLGELTSLYPPAVLVDQLLEPLLHGMRTDQQQKRSAYGSATQLTFFESTLQGYFASALYRQRLNNRPQGPRWLLVDVGRTPDPVLPMILAYSLGVNNHRVDFFGPIQQAELMFAVEKLGSESLLLYADSAALQDVGQQREGLHQRDQLHQRLQLPVWLGGRQVALCPPSLKPFCLGQTHQEIISSISLTVDGGDEAGESTASGFGA